MALHAIMQMNDGQRIEAGRTEIALNSGALDPQTYQTLLLGLSKQSIFAKKVDTFGPDRVRDELAAFDAGPDGHAIESLRPSILAINNGGKVGEVEAKRWRDAMVARNRVWSAAVENTVDELIATTAALRADARWQFILYIVTSG